MATRSMRIESSSGAGVSPDRALGRSLRHREAGSRPVRQDGHPVDPVGVGSQWADLHRQSGDRRKRRCGRNERVLRPSLLDLDPGIGPGARHDRSDGVGPRRNSARPAQKQSCRDPTWCLIFPTPLAPFGSDLGFRAVFRGWHQLARPETNRYRNHVDLTVEKMWSLGAVPLADRLAQPNPVSVMDRREHIGAHRDRGPLLAAPRSGGWVQHEVVFDEVTSVGLLFPVGDQRLADAEYRI